MEKPVIFYRLRQEGICQFRRRALAKETQTKLLLALDRMALAVPICGKVSIYRIWEYLDLISNEFEEGDRRSFSNTQSPAGITQIATHQSVTQAILVPMTAPNGDQVSFGQGIMTNQFTLFGRRVKQLRNLRFTQSLPSRQSCLLNLDPGRPPDPGQRVDQRATLYVERSAHRGFRGATIEGHDHCGEFFAIDAGRSATMAAAPPCCGKSGMNTLLDQGSFELRERAKNVEQEFALRCGGVHLLGQRPKSDTSLFEVSHSGEKMRQRSAKPIEFPDDEAIACLDESQRLGQASTIAAASSDPIFEQMALINPGAQKSVTLQVHHLTIAGRRDTHVADQHVRKTSHERFPHSAPFRQGLSYGFWGQNNVFFAGWTASRKSTDSRQPPKPA